MDLRMPIMNGYEATRRIKRLRPSLPIIAHTAYKEPEGKGGNLQDGFDEYLPKPLNQKILSSILSKYKK